MHIVIHDDTRNVRTADIDDAVEVVSIGSDPDCHVYLPDIRVAEEHFRLCRREDHSWCVAFCPVPEGSSASFTRIYLNALEAAEGAAIAHNDEIQLARFRLRVFTDDADANAPRSAILEDAARIRAHPLPPGSVIRPHADNDVTLPAGFPQTATAFAFSMHECIDLAGLMAATITALFKHFKPHQVWMGARRHGYGRMEFAESRLADGRAGGDPPRLNTYLFRCCERGQFVCCPDDDQPGIGSVMAIPLRGGKAILGMLYMDRSANDAPFGEEHLDLFTVLGFAVARQLELVVREQLKLQEAIVAGELSFMRELQSVMDPTDVPQWDALQLAIYCKPGLDSAGDIYDVMRMPNGLAAFLCGHVSGSPTTAALAMAEVRSAFRFAGLHADPPHVLHRALNWLLFDPKHPATLRGIGLVMNPNTGAMQFASAGKFGALAVGQRGQLRSLVTAGTPEVGAVKDHVYESAAGRLNEGDSLVLYSPGCLTVSDASGKTLDEEQFTEALADGYGQSASTALADLLSDLRGFFKDGRQPDDITIMVLRRE
ncbi:MAG: SpoIIE family protein phosphatase [Phycisphaerales bacterium]|nr:SpoIIE family protein phosphatase [Phycisphaerales bacterium]